jgi:hypothetical protein
MTLGLDRKRLRFSSEDCDVFSRDTGLSSTASGRKSKFRSSNIWNTGSPSFKPWRLPRKWLSSFCRQVYDHSSRSISDSANIHYTFLGKILELGCVGLILENKPDGKFVRAGMWSGCDPPFTNTSDSLVGAPDSQIGRYD